MSCYVSKTIFLISTLLLILLCSYGWIVDNADVKLEGDYHLGKLDKDDYKEDCSICPLLQERLVYIVLTSEGHEKKSAVDLFLKSLGLNKESSKKIIKHVGINYIDTMTVKDYNLKFTSSSGRFILEKKGEIKGINDNVIKKLRENKQLIHRAGLLCDYTELPFGIDDELKIDLKKNINFENKWKQIEQLGIEKNDRQRYHFKGNISLQRMCDILSILKQDSAISFVMLHSDRLPNNY